jgi:predicted PurR-regulated permease PerM
MDETPKQLYDIAMERLISKNGIDLFIRIGLISFLVVYCYQIFKPFMGLMLWSLILAVALYPLQTIVSPKLGGKQGLTAAALIIVIFLGALVPTSLLVVSFAEETTVFVKQVQNGTFKVPAPSPTVAEWPVVGESLYAFWASAHTDIGGVIAKIAPKLSPVTKQILGHAASAGTALLKFFISLVLAGIWMAYATAGHKVAIDIAKRMAGDEKGTDLVILSTATIRAVAQGVIGIACLQALLLGAGFIMVEIPGAGLLALLALILGVMQIPTTVVALPVVIYVFMTNDSTIVAVIFTVYTVLAGSCDNILKPMLLGRGVKAPMPVILLGALGGMATSGIIGLFLGSIMLALGYQLFMMWVYSDTGQEAVATIES